MNPSSVAALADSAFDVANLAKQVRDAACQSLHIDGTASQELLAAAQDLILSLQRPEERLISIAKAPVDNVVLRVAIDIDLFSKFGQGTKSAGELAEVCGVDKVLLVRLMRTLTALEIYKEVDTEVYASSNLSDVLVDPTSRAVYNGMATTAEIMLSLPCYLRHNSYANPATFSVPLFHFSINDPSASYFKWLETHPRELAIFTAYQAATAELLFKEVEPLLERLIKQAAEVVGLIGLKEISNPLQEQRRYEMEAAKPVLLVDIGSGKGETTRKVCGAMLDVIGEGRVILQDLPGVVEKTEKMYRVEAMAHDFFEEQPIRGAPIYFLRNVLHNWSDADCATILSHTTAAMAIHSRLVVVETVLPEKGVSHALAVLDLSMMAFGGLDRTFSGWNSLLERAGMKVERIILLEGTSRILNYAVFEAVRI